jgi:PAS domain S-box-containing protein
MRRFINDLPIRRKLLLVTMVTCGTALALACTALFWFQSVQFRKGFVAELESLAAIIAQNSAAPLAFDDSRSAVEVLSALQVKPHITSACVFDAQGRLFARFGPADDSKAVTKPGDNRVVFDDGFATLTLPVAMQDAAPGRLQLRARFQDQYRELLSIYGLVLGAVLGGSLVVIFVVTSLMQRIIAGPIAALAEIARNVSEKEDYITRAPEAGRDEVGLLTRTFNQMLDQIQSRDRRLRESQQRFEVAVMGSSDGLWDWDLVTNLVYFSPRWKSMLGYGEEELANSFDTFWSLVHPDDIQRVQARVDAYLRGGEGSYDVEFRARHKNGGYRWILSRGAALWEAPGKAFRFAGSHTDISERKQTEDLIRRSRAKFESLVNSIHGIVWEADPVTLQLRFISNQVEAILGHSARRWLEYPQLWEESAHPDDRVPIRLAAQRGIAEGSAYQLEYRRIAADGRAVWLRESVSVEREGDRPVRLRGVSIDITAQKQAADDIIRMQRELVETSRLAGMAEVATGVLHNVGNVLNSVNVSANLMADQVRKSKTASLAKAVRLFRQHEGNLGEFLDRDAKGAQLPAFLEAVSEELAREQATLTKELEGIQQNVDHVKQIVAMQQSYARVSGVLEVLPLRELVEDALRMAAAGLTRDHVEVLREFEDLPPLALDRHKVLQILINLLNNARHALEGRPEGREIRVSVGHGEAGSVRVMVTDNGVGIPCENLARIFTHGFTTKKDGHGFGLHSGALAAKEMGGSLIARSQGLGKGATFVLELPVGGDANRRLAPPSDKSPQPIHQAAA